jgi:hypothetical protein
MAVPVNIVNIGVIVHTGGAGLSQNRETETFYKLALAD